MSVQAKGSLEDRVLSEEDIKHSILTQLYVNDVLVDEVKDYLCSKADAHVILNPSIKAEKLPTKDEKKE